MITLYKAERCSDKFIARFLQIGRNQVSRLLKRLGFSYKKNRLVPSKADPELQRLFVRWFEWFCGQLGPDDRFYFGDAVHFKHNAEAATTRPTPRATPQPGGEPATELDLAGILLFS